ncbi:uncharacterized protein BP01DRAFT_87498 [Aspergillus saccharolyticus JOP 1030-1]|uniref:Uncharacterized protein n=1 Tax=Aspergillus saccharolyticus JOP 1030-1 TaxID=1450539 RepID=A0A318Z9E1_9EURO|nr:hypothetical protein BP01DRAFT_87498 [Aspergillus saccharolyticus JOP 1030-1]PYH44021.1 hypothetical protein BP01DRAFT_87498 [Aspergillus saccharolyticus JOP 1030-1]
MHDHPSRQPLRLLSGIQYSMDSAGMSSMAHCIYQSSDDDSRPSSTVSDTNSRISSPETPSHQKSADPVLLHYNKLTGLDSSPTSRPCTHSTDRPNPRVSRPITGSSSHNPSAATARELKRSFRALSCHHQKLQQKHAELMKRCQEKDHQIACLNAQIGVLESELYLTRLAYSDDAFDPLQTSLNQYDIRPTGDAAGREQSSCDVAMTTP